MAPYFTSEEQKRAVRQKGGAGGLSFRPEGKINLVPFPAHIDSPGHQAGSICPAFDPETHFCGIYAERPLDCRLYPFLLIKKEENVILATDTKCPFISDTSRQTEIENYGKRLLSVLSLPSYRKLIESNPGLVGPFQDDMIPFSALFRENGP